MGPLPVPEYPALDDNAGWYNFVAAVDNMMLQRLGAMMPATDGPRVELMDADRVRVYVINQAEADGPVYLEGLPIPAGTILLTPALDLTRSGDTHRTNLGVDTILQDASGTPLTLYAAEHDPRHPYLSPLHGDFSLGFSPALLASGTRDLLLSDAVRMHRALRAASISAELHVLEAAPHVFLGGTAPEDEQLHAEVRRFIADHTPPDLIVPAATHTA
jgi:acetyl esterase/lipase